jgi:GAF domain-containing protein
MDANDSKSKDYLDIARLVGLKRPLPAVYKGVHAVLRRRMPAKNMYIGLIEGQDGLRFPYFVDEIEPENPLKIYPKQGLTGYIVDTKREAWLRRDPGLLERAGLFGPRPVDWMGVPLVDRAGAVFGALAVQTYEEGSVYDEEDRDFIEFAATQVALAVQCRRFDRDIAIDKIAALVDETTDLDELYPGIHRIVADLIPAAERNFIIARIDETAGLFRPVYWRDEKDDWNSIEWPLDRGMCSYICRVTHSSFIYEHGKTPPPPDIFSIGTPPSFWLGSPLFNGEKIVGVVLAQSYDPEEPITWEDEATLVAVCPHIAQAIGSTEFFELTYRSAQNHQK